MHAQNRVTHHDTLQAREDEELARAIAASLGDDTQSAPAQPAASSAPPQQRAASSAGPRPAARADVEAGDVVSSGAPSTSQPGHKGISLCRIWPESSTHPCRI